MARGKNTKPDNRKAKRAKAFAAAKLPRKRVLLPAGMPVIMNSTLLRTLDIAAEFPSVETPVTALLRLAADLPDLVTRLPSKQERDSACLSLALAVGRAEYHGKRFGRAVDELERRRLQLGVFSTTDVVAKYAIFEAAACFGAARAAVDELVYLVARTNGAADAKQADKDWKASDVYKHDPANPGKAGHLSKPDVALLQKHVAWFNQLNDYRNVLHHRGWKETTGVYAPGSYEGPPIEPAEHVMIIPDQASVADKRKLRPHDWAYTSGLRLEPLVRDCLDGMRSAFEGFVVDAWKGTPLPEDDTPDPWNVGVRVPHPMVYVANPPVVPLFTSVAKCRKFIAHTGKPGAPYPLPHIGTKRFLGVKEALMFVELQKIDCVVVVDPLFDGRNLSSGAIQVIKLKANEGVWTFMHPESLYCLVTS